MTAFLSGKADIRGMFVLNLEELAAEWGLISELKHSCWSTMSSFMLWVLQQQVRANSSNFNTIQPRKVDLYHRYNMAHNTKILDLFCHISGQCYKILIKLQQQYFFSYLRAFWNIWCISDSVFIDLPCMLLLFFISLVESRFFSYFTENNQVCKFVINNSYIWWTL